MTISAPLLPEPLAVAGLRWGFLRAARGGMARAASALGGLVVERARGRFRGEEEGALLGCVAEDLLRAPRTADDAGASSKLRHVALVQQRRRGSGLGEQEVARSEVQVRVGAG